MTRRSIEPCWQPRRALQNHLQPQLLADWVLEPNSMTARLRARGGPSFRVNVICHDWGKPRPSEIASLQLPKDSAAIIREVELICHDNVCIFARSIYPATSMLEKNHVLRHLGDRPVGDVLYSDANLHRTDFELAKLRSGHADYQRATAHLQQKPHFLWARRSIFIVNERPILISEIFTPNIL